MAKTKTHKTGNTKFHKGKKVNEYSDGCWRYDGSGALAIRSPAWRNITKETSGAMQQLAVDARKEKKRQAIVKATQEAMGADGKLKIKLPDDAAAYVAGELWSEALQHEQLLASRLKVYQEIGFEVGIVDRTEKKGAGVQAIQVNINISEKATAGIEEEDQILDGLWTEISRKE